MIKIRLTLKRINELIKEEEESYLEYKKLGFISMARDEKRHAMFLKELKKRYVKVRRRK